MEQNDENEAEQAHTTVALTIAVPEKVGWAIRTGDDAWSGDDIKGLAQHLGKAEFGWPATLSVSLQFELTGDCETIRSRPNYPTKGRGI